MKLADPGAKVDHTQNFNDETHFFACIMYFVYYGYYVCIYIFLIYILYIEKKCILYCKYHQKITWVDLGGVTIHMYTYI